MLLGARPESGSLADALARLCTRLYRCVAATSRAHLAGKRGREAATSLPPGYLDLVARVNAAFTPSVYACVQEAQAAAGEGARPEGGKRARAAAGRLTRRVRKESQVVPALVFQIEEHEKQLIRLSRAGEAGDVDCGCGLVGGGSRGAGVGGRCAVQGRCGSLTRCWSSQPCPCTHAPCAQGG